MRVDTTRFGVLEIDDSSIIRMPRGPLGFEDQTDYCLVQHRPDTAFRWLQSIDEPALAFVVIDPAEFFPNYEIELTDADAEKLHLESESDAMVLVIANVAGNGREITANLAAPIVLNANELVGMQVVLQDTPYSVRQPLMEQLDTKREQNTTAGACRVVETKAA